MFLSKQVETVFKSPPTEAGLCERRYHALEKLYNNEVITLYPHKYTSGVFGLKLHQLQEASSEANRKHFGLAKKENIIRKAWNLVAPAKESSHKSQ
ncbi:unnamed protein product [Auanema sp. JU1783]|nr:unnamed protein product [Auanema sp. JU1783]